MEKLNKKTESVLIQMLQSKPIVLPSSSSTIRVCSKRVSPLSGSLTDEDDDVMILDDEPRRWSKKRRLLGKIDKKSLSSGEDDSGGSSSGSSSGSPSDGECCECPNDSGCDDNDEDDTKEEPGDKIEELCWQLEENFKENSVSFLQKKRKFLRANSTKTLNII